MKEIFNQNEKNDKDLLSLSFTTKDVLLKNESRANRIVSFILIAVALGLFASNYFISSSVTADYFVTVAIIIFCLSLLAAGGGILGLLTKNNYPWLKWVLMFDVILTFYSFNYILGNAYDLILIIPLMVSCSYCSKKFSLKIGIILVALFLIGDFVSIYTKQYSDLNLIIFNQGTFVDFSDHFSRFEISKDNIDVVATIENFYLSYGIFRYIIFTICCFSVYLICKSSERNLYEQAKIIEEELRLKEEINLAKDLQSNYLPINFDEIKKECKNIDIFGLLIGSTDIAGDLYDFFLINKTKLCFMIGDISTRGVSSTLFMQTIKESIEAKAKQGLLPNEIFYLVNNEICSGNNDFFVTMWLGILDIEANKLIYCNAGQNKPLISTKGVFDFVDRKIANLFLGGKEDTIYENEETTYNKNTKLFLYTDSVVRALNREKEMFTEKRLISYLNNHHEESVENLINGVKSEIDDFQKDIKNDDDITMLAIEIRE